MKAIKKLFKKKKKEKKYIISGPTYFDFGGLVTEEDNK